MAEIKENTLSPYRCIDNHQLQDWMVDVGLMSRLPLPPDFPPVPARFTSISRGLIAELKNEYGYVVPYDQLADGLYGSTNQPNIDAVGSLAGYLTRRYPDFHLFKAPGLGLGMGIEKLKLGHQVHKKLPLIYLLWEDLDNFVALGKLASRVYGIDDDLSRPAASLHLRVLIKQFSSDDEIQTEIDRVRLPESGWHYKLSGSNHQKPRRIYSLRRLPRGDEDKTFPDYLKIEFQRWLVEKTGLMRQKWLLPEHHRTPVLKPGENLAPGEEKVFGILSRFPGFIVPHDYLQRELLGDSKEYRGAETIQVYVYRLRRRIQDPSDIYLAPALGYGQGVDELKVSRIPLMIINRLRRGVPFKIEDLFFHVYGSAERVQSINTIRHMIGQLRRFLLVSPYNIAQTSQVGRGLAYFLTERQGLAEAPDEADLDLMRQSFTNDLALAKREINQATTDGRYNSPAQELVPIEMVSTHIEPVTSDKAVNDHALDIYSRWPDLLRLAGSLARRYGLKEEADDIVSEAAITAMEYIKKHSPYIKNLGGFMAQIVKHTAADRAKRLSHYRTSSLNADPGRSDIDIPDFITPEITIGEEYEDTAYSEAIIKLLPFFPRRDRIIFILRELFHISPKDVAAITQNSYQINRGILFRTRRKMADLVPRTEISLKK